MIRTWKITANKNTEIQFSVKSSLDAVTRQLPNGYYTTFRTYDGCTSVLGLKAHLRRLPNVNASSLRRSLLQLLAPYHPGEARVRVMQTKSGMVYVSIEPFKPLLREIYEKGIRVETTNLQRTKPREKSTTFIGASAEERKHIARAGIHEALLVKNGRILEGMTSNFFYVRDRVLYTAQRGVLPGVTRTMVIRAARGRGVKVRYGALKLSQLSGVSEAFITSSSRGVVPVIQIDDINVGQGSPGMITRKLMTEYEDYILSHTEEI
jgi:branched-chain amino acid aminotransferase